MSNNRLGCGVLLAQLTACATNTTGGGTVDAQVADVQDATGDGSGADSLPADTGPDAAQQDVPAVDGGAEYGFALRVPQVHKITCSKYPDNYPLPKDPKDFPDTDFLCTFKHGGAEGKFYLQATPVDCTVIMNETPILTAKGWLALDGKVTELAGATYDWGGNHHNDSIQFDWNGKHYAAAHSSYGFGFRKCQPMDCLEVSTGPGAVPTEDGCTTDRTLPIVCVAIEADGSHKPLVDTFKKCLGDPNGP